MCPLLLPKYMHGQIRNKKREALQKAYVDVNPNEEPAWLKDENLITWLKKF